MCKLEGQWTSRLGLKCSAVHGSAKAKGTDRHEQRAPDAFKRCFSIRTICVHEKRLRLNNDGPSGGARCEPRDYRLFVR